MAIIACPQCGKKISDKSQSCPHCQLSMTGMTADRIDELNSRKRIDRMQSYINQSMLALVIFLAGFCVLYFWQSEPDSWQLQASQAAIAVGFLWYIAARAMIIYLKRKN
ncbi:zinc ribbon domain-containing protein [Rheinheimera sp.]|uniref:zinc ribbon domain-containing protein n=1 Tax=Rheinheimera sp. TaxID=1869214 RepID=UPI00307F4BAF